MTVKFVRIGNSGLKLTEVTFGTALTIGTESSDIAYANQLVSTAWDFGIRSFDTSNNYGNGEAERLLGEALQCYPRDEYVLATKGSWPIGDSPYHSGLSRKHILWACENSLARLGVEYIDIYYAHRYDPEVPMEEIVRTFNELIYGGKIRYWATSEWPIAALSDCHKTCLQLGMERPILEQFIYSYALRKAEINGVKAFCDANGVGTLGFSPLCQGYLAGRYLNGIPQDSRVAKSAKISYNKTTNFYNQNKVYIDYFLGICNSYNVPYTTAALQWGIRKGIYPVLGASKPTQLQESMTNLQKEIPEECWTKLQKLPY